MDPMQLVVPALAGPIANLITRTLRPVIQDWWASTSRRRIENRIEQLQDVVDLIQSNQYVSMLQAESRHQITLAAIFVAGGAVMTRIEPLVGVQNNIGYTEIITFGIGFALVMQSTLTLRAMYPRRLRKKKATIEAHIVDLRAELAGKKT